MSVPIIPHFGIGRVKSLKEQACDGYYDNSQQRQCQQTHTLPFYTEIGFLKEHRIKRQITLTTELTDAGGL